MSGAARITSIDVVRDLRVAVEEFGAEAQDAITQLLLELRRAVDWVEQDRARYWPREAQRASDAVIVARNDLERCELALREEDKRSCYEQKLALEKAKRRQRYAEDRARAVRRWRVTLSREADRFEGHMAKLANYLETDVPRALAALERMIVALDRYAERSAPTEGEAGAGPTASAAPTTPAASASETAVSAEGPT